MKKRGRSLVRDVQEIAHLKQTINAQLEEIKRIDEARATLKREAVHARGQAVWAAHVLGIAGECLQSRGGLETARLCRITAGNLMPAEQGCTMAIGANENGERR